MFNDISCDGKGNKEECLANDRVVSVFAKRFGIGQWSFNGPGSEQKWYSMEENSPQGIWDHIADEMLLEFAESGCLIFRATTPLSRSKLKSKGHGKLSIHFTADYQTIDTVFRIIVSANQLSLYGAVANMCEEFETHQDISGQFDVLMGQSIVLRLQRHEERIEMFSRENKMSKFCLDAGFIHVVEIGQYFVTKDTVISDNFIQWLVVNTLFQEMMDHHNQEDGFREIQNSDPYWKSRPVICTVNMELKSGSAL